MLQSHYTTQHIHKKRMEELTEHYAKQAVQYGMNGNAAAARGSFGFGWRRGGGFGPYRGGRF
jgi:hypothetical protein